MGWDGRTFLVRLDSQARTGTGKYIFSSSADHEQGKQSYPVNSQSTIVMDIQAYIYTCTKVLIRHGTIDASFFGVITLETEINVQSDIAINAVEDRASLHLSY